MIGRTVSHYRIEEKLGEGGMGVVYLAEDLRLKRAAALKFLPPHLVADLRAKDRFFREAQAASALDHPNICVIFGIDETADGELFIAMAHYAGETLAQKLARGPLPIREALEVTRQVARGLSKAHAGGIIHRDIKPANLMGTEDGIWKILDFGIAKLSGAARLTRTGRGVGTVAYMSPEQAERDEVSPQSDLWSLGVVLYEALAGRLPFVGATPVATLYQILQQEPDPLGGERGDVPPELDRILGRALKKDLEARYGGMGELLADLDSLQCGDSGPAYPSITANGPEQTSGEPRVTSPPFLTPEKDRSGGVMLPPFVGRGEELAVLEAWLQEAVAGRGRIGFLSGEAGSGKSALAREFCRKAMESDEGLIAATGSCGAHTGIGDPYHPFREIMGLLFGDVEAQWAGGSVSADHATRLWSLFPSAVRSLLDSGPGLVPEILSGTALLARADAHPSLNEGPRKALRGLLDRRGSGVQQPDLIDQFTRVLRTLAREKPLLMVMDDLQWADAGSLAVLFQLGRRLAGTRILVLGLFRPSEVALGREGRRHPLEPVINELSGQFGKALVEVGATGDRQFVDALVDAEPNRLGSSFRSALYARTLGHPLFSVELFRSMKERGKLFQDEDGVWIEAAGLSWDALPARTEAVIGERLGRLTPALRRLLAIACVQGAEFTLEVAAKALGQDPRELIAPATMELERRHRLIVTEGLRRLGGERLSVFRFRHILFQRYLYDELTEIERSHLHEQVGEALEGIYGDQRDEIALPLARHFLEAGLPEKALAYLKIAGLRARNMGAFPEAVGHFQLALDALLTQASSRDRDREELELQLELANARTYAAFPGQEEAASRVHELALEFGSKRQLFWALQQNYAVFAHFKGDHRLGRRLAEEALSLAREIGDAGLVVHGLLPTTWNAALRGDFPFALACCEELVSTYDPEAHRDERFSSSFDPGPTTLGLMGEILWFLGYPDQALARCEEAVALARDLRSPSTLVSMQMYMAWVLVWSRELEPAQRLIETVRARGREIGLGWVDPMADIFGGWCRVQQGSPTEGIASMERGLGVWKEIGWGAWLSYGKVLLSEALRLDGRAEEGLKLWEQAHEPVEVNEDFQQEAEMFRIRGELFLALPVPEPKKAEEALRTAIHVAQGQEARSYELRATTSLARLLRQQGRVEEARRMLREIHGWFTEGSGTYDLIEAKALLEELAKGSGD